MTVEQAGQSEQAIETYKLALTLQPGLVDAHSNLGNLYKSRGMLPEAKRYVHVCRVTANSVTASGNGSVLAVKVLALAVLVHACYKHQ